MAEQVFVGRERELARLTSMLTAAMAGETQVCFVTGEAGAGKSSLVGEFARRAQDTYPDLVVAVGICNAQTGVGDPYLPFREVLAQLTGDIETKLAQKQISSNNAGRLKNFLRLSGATLLEFGPDLIGTLIPGAALVGRVAAFAADETGVTDKLKLKSESATAGPAELDQAKILQQYASVLHQLSLKQPLILVLDDLQWADTASVNLLFHLTRQLPPSRILFIGTYRPDDVALGRGGDRHPLEQVVNEVKRYYGDILVDLDEERDSDGRGFIDAYLDAEPNMLDARFRDALFDRTGGHPLFTVELLQNMEERGDLVRDEQNRLMPAQDLDWDALPARVEGVVEERISRLEEELRDILNVASVEGIIFTTQVIARLQEIQERQLLKSLSRDLEKRHRLVEEAGEQKVGREMLSQYRFSQNVFQQYLYNELSSGERRLLHGDIAEALEELYVGNTDRITVQLARHFELANDTEKAAYYLSRAGVQAFQISAYTQAREFFERALTLAQEADNREWQIRLTRQVGQVHLGLSEFEAARARLEESLALARAANDRAGIAAALGGLGRMATEMGAYDEAHARLEESLALAREAGDRAVLIPILKNLGMVAVWLGRYDDARVHLEESLQLARAINDLPDMASALNHLGHISLDQGQYEQARTYLEESLPLAREIGDRGSEAVALFNLGMVESRLGLFADAYTHEQEALTLARKVGNKWVIAGVLSQLGVIAPSLGPHELPNAERYLREALQTATEISAQPVALFALYGMANLRAEQGRQEEAAELLGVVLNNPATIEATRELAEDLLENLRPTLLPEVLSAALERGKAEGIAGALREMSAA